MVYYIIVCFVILDVQLINLLSNVGKHMLWFCCPNATGRLSHPPILALLWVWLRMVKLQLKQIYLYIGTIYTWVV